MNENDAFEDRLPPPPPSVNWASPGPTSAAAIKDAALEAVLEAHARATRAAHATRATVIPTRIRVGPYTYKVMKDKTLDLEGVFGRTNNILREIHLSVTGDAVETAITLLHELTHAAWEVYGLAGIELKDMTAEQVVRCLSNGLAQVLGDIGLWPREIVLEDEGQPGGV